MKKGKKHFYSLPLLSKIIHAGYLVVSIALVLSCGTEKEKVDTVYVSILPQRFFVEQVAGDAVTVEVMVRPGMNPAMYEPLPGQMRGLSEARLYFSIGVPFEHSWLPRIESNYKSLRIVDTSRNIELQPMPSFDEVLGTGADSHRHEDNDDAGKHEGHGHNGHDPHIWLSTDLVKVQAEVICEALISEYPGYADEFKANLDVFQSSLDSLGKAIKGSLDSLESRKMLVYHPAWGYFANEYDMEQIPVEFEGKEPSGTVMNHLGRYVEQHGLEVMYVQRQFSSAAAEAIADELGLEVVILDPLAENYMDNMYEIASTIENYQGVKE